MDTEALREQQLWTNHEGLRLCGRRVVADLKRAYWKFCIEGLCNEPVP